MRLIPIVITLLLVSCDGCFYQPVWTPHELYDPGLGGPGISTDCTLDVDCDEGFACEAQRCLPVCNDDDDCPEDLVCRQGENTEQFVCQPGPGPDVGSDASRDAGDDGDLTGAR